MATTIPILSITGVWKFAVLPMKSRRYQSLPGHQIHWITSGSYQVRISGREYDIRAGDLVYYYESEEIEWIGSSQLVEHYSVGFRAPELPPLPLDCRVMKASSAAQGHFKDLFEASLLPDPVISSIKMCAALCELLVVMKSTVQQTVPQDKEHPWWSIEHALRRKHLFRAGLKDLAEISGYSPASIDRICRKATGKSPMKRLREIRMQEATGLLRFSNLSISGIADHLGYPRVHEFSREFRNHFNASPSTYRSEREVVSSSKRTAPVKSSGPQSAWSV